MSKHSRLKYYGLAVIACAVAVALAGPFGCPVLVLPARHYSEQPIWRHGTWTLSCWTICHCFQLPFPAISTLSIKPLLALLTIRSFCRHGSRDKQLVETKRPD